MSERERRKDMETDKGGGRRGRSESKQKSEDRAGV